MVGDRIKGAPILSEAQSESSPLQSNSNGQQMLASDMSKPIRALRIHEDLERISRIAAKTMPPAMLRERVVQNGDDGSPPGFDDERDVRRA